VLSHITEISHDVDNELMLVFKSQGIDGVWNDWAEGLNIDALFLSKPKCLSGAWI